MPTRRRSRAISHAGSAAFPHSPCDWATPISNRKVIANFRCGEIRGIYDGPMTKLQRSLRYSATLKEKAAYCASLRGTAGWLSSERTSRCATSLVVRWQTGRECCISRSKLLALSQPVPKVNCSNSSPSTPGQLFGWLNFLLGWLWTCLFPNNQLKDDTSVLFRPQRSRGGRRIFICHCSTRNGYRLRDRHLGQSLGEIADHNLSTLTCTYRSRPKFFFTDVRFVSSSPLQ